MDLSPKFSSKFHQVVDTKHMGECATTKRSTRLCKPSQEIAW
jgi:hypothetical protein